MEDESTRDSGSRRGTLSAIAVALGFLALGAAAGYFGWWVASPRGQDPGHATHANGGAAGSEDLGFLLPSLDGAQSGPAAHLGEVVIVDFWTTWCGPCHAQARILAMLFEEVGDDVRFFAVDVAEDEETVGDFVADRPFPYPVLLDADGAVAARAGVYGFPTVMVYDRSGEVVYRRSGISGKRALLEAVQGALEPSPDAPAVASGAGG